MRMPRKTSSRRRSRNSRAVVRRASARKRASHLDEGSMAVARLEGLQKAGREREGRGKRDEACRRRLGARRRLAEEGAETGGRLFLGDALLLGLLLFLLRGGGGATGRGGSDRDGRGAGVLDRRGDVGALEGGDQGLDAAGVRVDTGG